MTGLKVDIPDPSAEGGKRRRSPSNASIEILTPSARDPSRRAKAPSAVFALVSTIIGGGSLSLPYAFSMLGVAVCLGCFAFIALANDLGASLLVDASRRSGGGSYEEVAYKAFGRKMQAFTIVLLLLLTYLCCVAYLVLIGDLVVPLVEQYIFHKTFEGGSGRAVVMSICFCIVLPLCMMKQLNALRFTSMASTITISILAVAMGIRMFQANLSDHSLIPDNIVWVGSFRDIVYGFPLVSVAFLCHFNVLSVHGELIRPTQFRIKTVIHLTMSLCTFMYIVIGLFGYLLFFDKTKGDILNNYDKDDSLINIGRACLSVTLHFSFPLLALPCRDAFERLLAMLSECCCPGAKGEVRTLSMGSSAGGRTMPSKTIRDPIGDEARLLLSANHSPYLTGIEDEFEERFVEAAESSTLFRVTETLLLIGSALGFAIFVPTVVIVWSIMGSTVSIFISYILPAVFYLKIRSHKPFSVRKAFAWFLLFFGCSACVLCTYESIYSVLHPISS